MEFEVGFAAFWHLEDMESPWIEAKYHACADSRHIYIYIYIVFVSACAIPFLLIKNTHTQYTPNHHTARNLVNLSRATCRSKGQVVLINKKGAFFIHNRIRKLQPNVNQKEGRAFVRTSSDGASQTWILEPSDVKCTTKWEEFLECGGRPFYNW